MNRFIRLGTTILNLDHVIEIRFKPDAYIVKERPALWITTSEITESNSRVLLFLDDDAIKAWEFLRGILDDVDGKLMRSIAVADVNLV